MKENVINFAEKKAIKERAKKEKSVPFKKPSREVIKSSMEARRRWQEGEEELLEEIDED